MCVHARGQSGDLVVDGLWYIEDQARTSVDVRRNRYWADLLEVDSTICGCP